jgi:hypothetical protein
MGSRCGSQCQFGFSGCHDNGGGDGIGGAAIRVRKGVSRWWLGIANAVAAGLMLGASHNLITEGTKKSCGDCSPQDSAKIN